MGSIIAQVMHMNKRCPQKPVFSAFFNGPDNKRRYIRNSSKGKTIKEEKYKKRVNKVEEASVSPGVERNLKGATSSLVPQYLYISISTRVIRMKTISIRAVYASIAWKGILDFVHEVNDRTRAGKRMI
jgi:hypothetical protein